MVELYGTTFALITEIKAGPRCSCGGLPVFTSSSTCSMLMTARSGFGWITATRLREGLWDSSRWRDEQRRRCKLDGMRKARG